MLIAYRLKHAIQLNCSIRAEGKREVVEQLLKIPLKFPGTLWRINVFESLVVTLPKHGSVYGLG